VRIKERLRLVRQEHLNSEHGQSLVELLVFMPVLIIIIAGIVEMGYYLNRYMNLLDASREAARYGADFDPVGNYDPQYNHNAPTYSGATINCDTTTEFYSVVACYAEDNMGVTMNPGNGYDDIVISAFTVKNGVVCYRWPEARDGIIADNGWSYMGNQTSKMSSAAVTSIVSVDASTISQGILIVEIFYQHQQALGLPFFTIFVPRDIDIYIRTTMPNPTAGSYESSCP